MASETDRKPVDVKLPNPDDKDKLAFLLYNVFTPEECQTLIDKSEKQGYQKALVNTGDVEVLIKDFRDSDRCIIDDPEMAGMIFDRIKEHLPSVWKHSAIVGLNERLRFLRYDPGQKFEAHYGKSSRKLLAFV